MPLPVLDADPRAPFPPLARALRDPDGLLAVGGDLSVPRLLNAYRHGAFPWYSEGQPILWWSPDPRVVFDTAAFHLPSRLRRRLKGMDWTLRADHDFAQVLARCADSPRRGQDGTWISPAMQAAYRDLHAAGHAHSVEAWAGDTLVGGIYGVAVGRMFFGESMFSARPDGSRVALAALARLLAGWGWPLVDAQVDNPHLRLLGARALPRADFAAALDALCPQPGRPGPWRGAMGERPASWLAGPAAA